MQRFVSGCLLRGKKFAFYARNNCGSHFTKSNGGHKVRALTLLLAHCRFMGPLFLHFGHITIKHHKITPSSPLSLPFLSLPPRPLHRPRCPLPLPLPLPRRLLFDPEICLCCSPFSTSFSCSETRSSPGAR